MLAPTLRQMNPIHALPSYFCKIKCHIILHLHLGLSNYSQFQVFLLNSVCINLLLILTTRPTHLNLLHSLPQSFQIIRKDFFFKKPHKLAATQNRRMQTSNQRTPCWNFSLNKRSRNFRCCGMFDDIVEETPGQLMTSNPPCIWDQEGGGKNIEQARETVCRIHTPSAREELLHTSRNQQYVWPSVYLTTVYQQQ